MSYIKNAFINFWDIFTNELNLIFHDAGVLVIFFLGGLGYPILYNFMYYNGILENTPIAVVDNDCSANSRRFMQKVDATRELEVAYHCVNMAEAQKLMQERKVNGIIYFPADFSKKLAMMETATLSIYADMSSFLYYKNLLLGTNFVMLDEVGQIQIERYSAAVFTEQEGLQLVSAIPYEENNPYNRAFSYTIFFLSAALLLVPQQTMFYGMSMLSGTLRENHHNFSFLPKKLAGTGVGRIVLGRGLAYWLLYMCIGLYVAFIVPAIFHFPQRGDFVSIFLLVTLFITDCVFFCLTWSTLITHRETVFLLLLVMSPVAIFLTGFSWPSSAIPIFWRYFSYIFPSTFACQSFINLNTAGGDLHTVQPQMIAMIIQCIVYYFLVHVAVYLENAFICWQEQREESGKESKIHKIIIHKVKGKIVKIDNDIFLQDSVKKLHEDNKK